jgi:hypothetical protein
MGRTFYFFPTQRPVGSPSTLDRRRSSFSPISRESAVAPTSSPGRLRISRDQISRIHGEPSQKPLLWRGFASTIFGTLSPAWGRSISWAADYRRILGHTQPSTTARCAHLDSDPMRRAVDTIGDTISTAMNAAGFPASLPNREKIDRIRSRSVDRAGAWQAPTFCQSLSSGAIGEGNGIGAGSRAQNDSLTGSNMGV